MDDSNMNDWDWLQHYAESGSDESFARVVDEHLGLVYATALRFTSNGASAEDITQKVFILLSEKTGSLTPRGSLASWLYQTSIFKSKQHLTHEMRRVRKEQRGIEMKEHEHPPAGHHDWQEIRPLIDEAMESLKEQDRSALLLRFFQEKSYLFIGEQIGISEDAARKRVTRAVEQLHRWFTKRGMRGTEQAMTKQLAAFSVTVPPSHLLPDTLAAVASKTVGASATSAGAFTSSWLSKPLILATFLGGAAIPASQLFSAKDSSQPEPGFEDPPQSTTHQEAPLFQTGNSEWLQLWQDSTPPNGTLSTLLNSISKVEDPFRKDLYKAMAYREWARHGFPISDGNQKPLDMGALIKLAETDPEAAARMAQQQGGHLDILENLLEFDVSAAAILLNQQTGRIVANISAAQLGAVAKNAPKSLGTFIRLMEIPSGRTSNSSSHRVLTFSGEKLSDSARGQAVRQAVITALQTAPASLDSILKDLNGWHREQVLAGWLHTQSPGDFEKAITILKNREEIPGVRGRALSSYLHQWIHQDPEKVIRFADKFSDRDELREHFGPELFSSTPSSALIADLAEKDLKKALSLMSLGRLAGADSNKLTGLVDRELIKDPEKILTTLHRESKKKRTVQPIFGALSKNPENHAPSIWQWCVDQTPDTFVRTIAQASIERIAQNDPERALDLYLENPSLIDAPYLSMTRHFVQSPVEEFEAFLERVPAGPEMHQLLSGVLQKSKSSSWSQEQQNRLYRNLPTALRPEVIRRIIANVTLKNPQEAIAMTATMDTPDEVVAATRGIIENWVSYDPASASEWADQLDRNSQREAASQELIQQFIKLENYGSAWAWAKDLDTGPTRYKELLAVLNHLKKSRTLRAAQNILRDNDLSPEEFASLSHALENSK